MKFRFLDNFIGLAHYAKDLHVSNYSQYTLSKFEEIEGSDSVFVKSNFSFFIYNIPENIVVCFFLYALFAMLSVNKISRFLRVYYFIRVVLAQNLIEENLSYFVYLSFSHLSHPFNYTLPDKISLVVTIFILFCLTVFSFTFYFLICRYLKKRSGLFVQNFYRSHSGICAIMIKSLCRSFLQGAAHFFLYNYYGWLMATLSGIEFLVIISLIVF